MTTWSDKDSTEKECENEVVYISFIILKDYEDEVNSFASGDDP